MILAPVARQGFRPNRVFATQRVAGGPWAAYTWWAMPRTKALVTLACALLGCGRVGASPSADAATQADARSIVSADDDASRPHDATDEGAPDASSDVADDVPYLDDAGFSTVEAPAGAIACGPRICNAGTEVCCWVGAGFAVACTPLDECSGGSFFECSSSLSCVNGDICCGRFGTGLRVGSSQCRGMCEPDETPLCALNAPCPAGFTCVPDGIAIAYCFPSRDGG